MASRSVGVVGGGLSGAMAALVLRSRGLKPTVLDAGRRSMGGRLAGGRHVDSGAQFLRASDVGSQWGAVLGMMQREGLVAPWEARIGLLGERGGFLPREVIGSSSVAGMLKEGGGGATGSDGVDFCGLLAGAAQPLHVGTPSNASVCSGICAAAGIDVKLGVKVRGAQALAAGGWRLSVETAEATPAMEFDALIIATHDPRLAAAVVQGLVDNEPDGGGKEVLQRLTQDLRTQREERSAPVFTWSGYFPVGTSAHLPFDAAVAPASQVVHLLVRDASKPGRPATRAEGELWSAVSRPDFAKALLEAAPSGDAGDSDRGGQAAAAATQAMSMEIGRLFSSYFGNDVGAVPPVSGASAKRWGAGLAVGSMELPDDAIGLGPWRLAIAGDYLRRGSGAVRAGTAEAAALSGLDAGERVAQWFPSG